MPKSQAFLRKKYHILIFNNSPVLKKIAGIGPSSLIEKGLTLDMGLCR
jgi:hypothetical protein